jgi:hypothetical protein
VPDGDCQDGLWGQVAVWPPSLVRVAWEPAAPVHCPPWWPRAPESSRSPLSDTVARFAGGLARSRRALLIILAGLAGRLLTESSTAWRRCPGTGGVFAQDVGVDAQGHGRIGLPKPGSDEVQREPRREAMRSRAGGADRAGGRGGVGGRGGMTSLLCALDVGKRSWRPMASHPGAVLGQVAVQLGDHGWSQVLEPRAPDGGTM